MPTPGSVTGYARGDSTQPVDIYVVTLADGTVIRVNQDQEERWFEDDESGEQLDLTEGIHDIVDDAVSRFDATVREQYRKRNIWQLMNDAERDALNITTLKENR